MTTNTPSLYDFKGHNIRVVTIDKAPWFVAADVCDALGLHPAPSNGSYQSHYRRLDADQLALATVEQTKGRSLRMKLVAEAGVYTLVMRSNKPEAKAFQDWVTGTVLPAIRKDGAYIKDEEKLATGEMNEDEFVLKAMEILNRKVARITAERDACLSELTRVSVAEYTALNHIYLSPSQKNRLSHRARMLTLAAGDEIETSVS